MLKNENYRIVKEGSVASLSNVYLNKLIKDAIIDLRRREEIIFNLRKMEKHIDRCSIFMNIITGLTYGIALITVILLFLY